MLGATASVAWTRGSRVVFALPATGAAGAPRGGDGLEPWSVVLTLTALEDRSGRRWLSVEAVLDDAGGSGRKRQGLRTRLPFPREGGILLAMPDPYRPETAADPAVPGRSLRLLIGTGHF